VSTREETCHRHPVPDPRAGDPAASDQLPLHPRGRVEYPPPVRCVVIGCVPACTGVGANPARAFGCTGDGETSEGWGVFNPPVLWVADGSAARGHRTGEPRWGVAGAASCERRGVPGADRAVRSRAEESEGAGRGGGQARGPATAAPAKRRVCPKGNKEDLHRVEEEPQCGGASEEGRDPEGQKESHARRGTTNLSPEAGADRSRRGLTVRVAWGGRARQRRSRRVCAPRRRACRPCSAP